MNARPNNRDRRVIGIAIVLAFAVAAPIAAQTIIPGDARSGLAAVAEFEISGLQ